jgi:alkanesulfonate monooxygenase SsuD/methylene tetrahydromethanopterin reductase-like flavin-dependent oxidoreductase (luciferase family)
MLAMQTIWRDDVAEYRGVHVDLAPSWSWPKPVPRDGRTGPPVLIGGAAGPKLFAAVAEYADGWIPIGGRGIRAALPDLHRACEEAERDPKELRIVPFGTIPDPGKLEYYATLGIEEIVLRVPSGGPDTVLPLLDRYAELGD